MDSPISEDYSLSWEGHTQHVRKAINRLLERNELCDVTLYAEGQKIGAHRVFLSACSEYFDQLFKDIKEDCPVIVLKGIQFDILKQILNFVYNGEASIEVERLHHFLEAAKFLNIDGLSENKVKRKRKNTLPHDFENKNVNYKQHYAAPRITDEDKVRNTQTCTDKEQFKIKHTFPKLPKLYKIDKSPTTKNKATLVNATVPNFTKATETGKYPMDEPNIVTYGEWLSDYEHNSQSGTIESQSPLEDNMDDTLSENNTVSEPLNKVKVEFEERIIKSEIVSKPDEELDSDVEEISSFDQNDFANSLDAEIDDCEDEVLEKTLMKTSLAAVNEDGQYVCKICNKTYAKKDSLKKHFAVHVNNTTCGICGKVLSRRSHLARHLNTHGINSK